ncbi:hypothetical protein AB5N19_13128 [Seiridium cardinale]
MLDNVELLAAILTRETGKSECGKAYHGIADTQLEDELQYEDDEVKIFSNHVPYGVIGAISPWNFPFILSVIKISSALGHRKLRDHQTVPFHTIHDSESFITTGEEDAPDRKGFWIAPVIVARPRGDSHLVAVEQLGPIIPVMSGSDEADVIARANIDNGGLGASVHTPDLDRAQKIARQLESGMLWINKSEIPHHAGFLEGMKLSGYGGELGKQALLSYCYTQTFQFGK